jgi:1-acyl-sn-glycerol-3-phosphate acyltransferase
MNDRADPSDTTDAKPATRTFAAVEATLRFLCDYHSYEVFGFDNVPRSGGALLVFHHSVATYDSFMLGVPILDRLGRLFRGLADRLIFRTPGLAHVFREAGFVEGTRKATVEKLTKGELIGLAPGGMRESLRAGHQKYTFDWTGRLGFVWASLLSGAPIVLCACPRADDLYTVVDTPMTRWAYERFRLPAPLMFGRWGTALPRRIKLWHLVAEPMVPDVAPDRVQESDVHAHHDRVVARMKRLMVDSLALGPVQEGGPG